MDADVGFMRRALELAEHARGLTSPNPMVGALVVRDGVVVGEGFHARAGAPHAEAVALADAGGAARGATLYVTLEPCVHQGRTPPCAPAVVAAGIRRVVVATGDPNPLVAGRGLDVLRAARIEVSTGVLEVEARAQNRVFLTAIEAGRPHVTLKAALTLDGKIADGRGGSRWITGDLARREAHRLRSEADAIVVGIGTVLQDDPQLTVRLDRPWPREPYRIVLDSTARTPPDARVIHAGTPARALIAVGESAPAAQRERLQAAGATVVQCPTRDGRVDVVGLLLHLFAQDVRAVLVEGGAAVHGAFLDAGVVDRVAFFIAPLLLGGRQAPSAVAGAGRDLKGAVRLHEVTMRTFGDDVLVEGDVRRS
ncbi:MAG TPA: bifunctional diaminohydroxyphosphoribosylaminopyrimidine deaminase/5-amino-6-(5-phosphoribosylamino)uracil reductase RibD [Methylomirabilota bacterium]|jgi:diaminohydroxyphosphoribosylaminopyrimidine deaminase/5-amino-6-(5-phosphoribosylamino)uracil reductase